MFFVVISRVKDKALLFTRLMLMLCILSILAAQLYGAIKTSGLTKNKYDKTPTDALRVEQQ